MSIREETYAKNSMRHSQHIDSGVPIKPSRHNK